METLTVDLKVKDLPEVQKIIRDYAFVLAHGRPWTKPDLDMVGQKFVMFTRYNTYLMGPLTKDFVQSGFVVAVQPYPSSPRKQQEALS